jgi:hypothetical protein
MGGILQVDSIKNNNTSNLITQTNTTTITIATSGQTVVIPSGTTFNASSASVNLPTGSVSISQLSATGTASASTFLRGDNSWASAGASAGQVIQVVSATDNTNRTTTSSSFVTGSNTLSVTITPSSTSNKIFVIASTCLRTDANSTYAVATIFRGSTNLGNSNLGMGSIWSTSGTANFPFTMHYLDSPASTSALTYQVYFRAANTGTIYLNGLDPNNQGSITVMEIKG